MRYNRRILEAFRRLHGAHPTARLLIVGGASLLDHRAYQRKFSDALSASGLPADAVIRTGPVPQADMPALYRISDALVFPSVREGFGLVVLEAMASFVPVVTSSIRPFTEHLGEDDVAWCDPLDVGSIAQAMASVLDPARRSDLVRRGAHVVARHDWRNTARAHLGAYAALQEVHHA